VAVPKKTIAVPKRKKLVPKTPKMKVQKKVPKRVATDEFIDMLILALEIFLIRTCYFYVSDQF
jgi:hypothetical protein